MMRTLFLQAPSFEGFDGGAGARYQNRREIKSFWYPTWLAQPAALVEGSKLIDAPPHRLGLADVLPEVKDRDLVVLHTSTPSFASDVKTVRALKAANPNLKIGMIGAKVAVDAAGSLAACEELDFVARNEFDFTIKEVAEGRDFGSITGLVVSQARRPHRSQRRARHPAQHGRAAVRLAGLQARSRRSRTTSSAICGTRICRSTPGAAANRAAPSACGRRPSAATTTAPAASATSSTS